MEKIKQIEMAINISSERTIRDFRLREELKRSHKTGKSEDKKL